MLKIGQLARRAGLTVRTLHHYDAIGLLSPSARSEGGFRLYTPADVRRLHRICTLRLQGLGLGLTDIRAVLDDPSSALAPDELLARQIAVLDGQLARLQALRDRLVGLRQRLGRGSAEAGAGDDDAVDWLTMLEMMTMMDKHLTPQEMAALRLAEDDSGHRFELDWTRHAAEVQAAMDRGVAVDSPEAHALAWRWMRLLRDATGNDVTLALKLTQMQHAESRAREISGITPALMDWIARAFASARSALLGKHLTPAQHAEVSRRQTLHVNDWPPLVQAVRAQMVRNPDPTHADAAPLARQWAALFLASYCGDDRVLEERVHLALRQEPDLMLGIGLDPALIGYIQRAILHMQHPVEPVSSVAAAAPKPSAHQVALQRAVHQLLDRPLVLDDPLALAILGPEDEAALRIAPERYGDRISTALRTSLVVRSRVAEDAWACRQPAGWPPGCTVFEVDLPDTQAWKRDCLRTAGIAEPANLRFVPIDFGRTTLFEALAPAGFCADEPAFFAWLGVVVYLEAADIDRTLGFIAACAPGSGVAFDYVVSPALLSPMERIGVEMVRARVEAQGEPWKSFFDPAALAGQLRDRGFTKVDSLGPDDLQARYLAGRSDGLRLGGSTRLMCAWV